MQITKSEISKEWGTDNIFAKSKLIFQEQK